MPAIHPDKLSQQARQVAAALADSDSMIQILVGVLAFYQDRTRRSIETTRAEDAVPAFNVPGLVLVQLGRALESALGAAPSLRKETVEALWHAGYRETMSLATDLIQGQSWAEAVEFVEEVVAKNESGAAAQLLTARVLSGWKTVPVDERLTPLLDWLHLGQGALHDLALGSLLEQVKSTELEAFPDYFRLLAGLSNTHWVERSTQLRLVLAAMAQRSPAETAQFLLDEFRGNNRHPQYRAMIKSLVDSFPPPQRAHLRAAISD